MKSLRLPNWSLSVVVGLMVARTTLFASGIEEKAAPVPSPAAARANATNTFRIHGMQCDGCAKGVEGELRLLPGVMTAEASFAKKLAVVAHDTNRVTVTQLMKAMGEAGFRAELLPPKEHGRR